MNVLPIDVIARSEGFEAAAVGRELRPWEWTFIHAVDGRTQLRDVAELCGLELALAAEIVSEQTEAGILRVVTMTLDDYRRWSGRESDLVPVPSDGAPPPSAAAVESDTPGRALHDELLAGLATESMAVAGPVAEPEAGPVEGAGPQLTPDSFASDLFAQELFTPEPLVAQPLAEGSAPDPFALEPLAPDPLAPDPFAHEPFADEPLAPDPFAPEPFAHEPFAHEPFVYEPLAPDPFAHEPFAQEPFAQTRDALEAYDPAPLATETSTAAKGVALSFDSFDSLDGFARLESAPAAQAPVAPEGITLSFEPGDPVADVSPSPFSSAAGGVSLSFEPDSSPLDALQSPATSSSVAATAFAPPAAPQPAVAEVGAQAAPPDSVAPIDLAFSSDGFPILTPAVSSPAPNAGLGAPAESASASTAPAAAPPPVARSSAPGDDHSDLVGSLIARVLSIRIK